MKKLNLLITILLTIGCQSDLLAHGHANAGAVDSNLSGGIDAGDKLQMYFEPGTMHTELTLSNPAGIYGLDGFWYDGFTTLTSLHQSSDSGLAPSYNSLGAPSGSYLQAQLQSIDGPENARVAFYDAGAVDPTWVYQIGTGFTIGTGIIDLTELSWFDPQPSGSYPSGPFGHVHGRRYAVDQAGFYTGTWILTDRQGLLTNSDSFSMTMNAVPEPGTWGLLALSAIVIGVWRKRSGTARSGA